MVFIGDEVLMTQNSFAFVGYSSQVGIEEGLAGDAVRAEIGAGAMTVATTIHFCTTCRTIDKPCSGVAGNSKLPTRR